MKRLTVLGISLSILFGFTFWIADSIYEYYMFQKNLEFMLYQEPLTFWDSLITNIPPHALFNRLSFLIACLFAGTISILLAKRWLESETRYKILSDNFPNGAIFLFDYQFKALVAGGKAIQDLGQSVEQAQRAGFKEIFADIWETMEGRCAEALKGRESYTELAHANRNYALTIIPVAGSKISRPQGILVIQDITAHRKAEVKKDELQAQLQQASKMEAIGTLAGGISHDFNNLLQAINGYTQLLLLDRTSDAPDYQYLKSIQDAGFRASDLVRQLLLFSRKADSTKSPIELQHEVERAKKMLERTIPKMIQIQVNTGDRLWAVNADSVQIEQMLLNLGTNAADAMPDGGKLLFEIENATLDNDYINRHLGAQPGRYVLLTVSDTGQGMAKDTIEKIFDPFFTTKEFGKGTGLGLASVYGIVKGHGGYIACYSEVGQGTAFKIYFPAIIKPEVEEAGNPEPRQIPRGSEAILIVDDDEAIRGLAQEALKRFGYSVSTASTGEKAMEIYSAMPNDIDLVIMDLGMPGMGGHKCLEELLRIDPTVKVIIASGYSINGQVKKSLDAGARGYVGKPYQLTDLLNTVRAVLDEES